MFDTWYPPFRGFPPHMPPYPSDAYPIHHYPNEVESAARRAMEAEQEFQEVKKKFDDMKQKYKEAGMKLGQAQARLWDVKQRFR